MGHYKPVKRSREARLPPCGGVEDTRSRSPLAFFRPFLEGVFSEIGMQNPA
jgi:hypothetical protein